MAKPSIEQVEEFWAQVRAGRITSKNFQRFLDNPDFNFLGQTVFKVVVDHGLTLAEMIKACGCNYNDSDITAEHFPIKGSGKVEVEIILLHLGREVTAEEVEAEFEKRGLRFARIEEFLALGAANPDLQRKFPLVTLGSRWQGPCGSDYVPCLCRRVSERKLYLYCYDRQWLGGCRFAAVRK